MGYTLTGPLARPNCMLCADAGSWAAVQKPRAFLSKRPLPGFLLIRLWGFPRSLIAGPFLQLTKHLHLMLILFVLVSRSEGNLFLPYFQILEAPCNSCLCHDHSIYLSRQAISVLMLSNCEL